MGLRMGLETRKVVACASDQATTLDSGDQEHPTPGSWDARGGWPSLCSSPFKPCSSSGTDSYSLKLTKDRAAQGGTAGAQRCQVARKEKSH